jgi:hypothetical protein
LLWKLRFQSLGPLLIQSANENADNKLLQAYLSEDDTNPHLIHDLPNLTALCKKLAVLKTFQQQKASG